jgi:carboxypeptidase Taq
VPRGRGRRRGARKGDHAWRRPLAAAAAADARAARARGRARARLGAKGGAVVKPPAKLVRAGQTAWNAARAAGDWSLFTPPLEAYIYWTRAWAASVDDSRGAYDVVLSNRNEGLTAARIGTVLDGVRAELPALVADLRARGAAPDASWLDGEYNTTAQWDLFNAVVGAFGFDFARGRFDPSFPGASITWAPNTPDDVRFVTGVNEREFIDGLYWALSTAGGALELQARGRDGLPASTDRGVFSSNRLWARPLGQSAAFAEFLLPAIQARLPEFGAGRDAGDLFRAVNKLPDTVAVMRGNSSEVTNALHAALQFEIERRLFDGSLAAADVPGAFDALARELFGAAPADALQGALQYDMWGRGAFATATADFAREAGAAQVFAAARAALPGLDAQVAAGDFGPLLRWLTDNVYVQGRLRPSLDVLLRDVSGAPLDAAAFMRYVRDKYSAAYRLPPA